MRIGIFVETSRTSRGGADVDAFVEQVRAVADAGFASAWSPQVFGMDALTALSIAGREVAGIELGTAVVPIYVHHPLALAQQALTAHFATGGRLTLGVGLSHQIVVETMWGLSFERPVDYMRDYLSALVPMLSGGGKVDYAGERIQARAEVRVPEGTNVPVLLAALGPRMLGLAGTVAAGTITWMTGPATIASHVVPTITKAAADAGVAAPRVVMALPTCVTDDEATARGKAAQLFAMYGMLPSYRAMLDREGAAGPADVAIVGDAPSVRSQVEALAEHGVTDFVGVPFENREATLEVLAGLL